MQYKYVFRRVDQGGSEGRLLLEGRDYDKEINEMKKEIEDLRNERREVNMELNEGKDRFYLCNKLKSVV